MIGIEMCHEAVEDAKVNAKVNGKRWHQITFGGFVKEV